MSNEKPKQETIMPAYPRGSVPEEKPPTPGKPDEGKGEPPDDESHADPRVPDAPSSAQRPPSDS